MYVSKHSTWCFFVVKIWDLNSGWFRSSVSPRAGTPRRCAFIAWYQVDYSVCSRDHSHPRLQRAGSRQLRRRHSAMSWRRILSAADQHHQPWGDAVPVVSSHLSFRQSSTQSLTFHKGASLSQRFIRLPESQAIGCELRNTICFMELVFCDLI